MKLCPLPGIKTERAADCSAEYAVFYRGAG